MEKLITTVSRFIFLAIFGIFSFTIFCVEIWGLVKDEARAKEVGFRSGETEKSIVASSNEYKEAKNIKGIQTAAVTEDARPLIIKKYLEKYKSPLAPYSDLIFELSQTYGYDYRWIVAIAQQESNLCKVIPEDSHNCWGYGIHKRGTLKFDNYEIALKSYAEYLKRAYFDKGLDTPELIMKKYCPSSNGSWAYGVKQFMDDMENGTF